LGNVARSTLPGTYADLASAAGLGERIVRNRAQYVDAGTESLDPRCRLGVASFRQTRI